MSISIPFHSDLSFAPLFTTAIMASPSRGSLESAIEESIRLEEKLKSDANGTLQEILKRLLNSICDFDNHFLRRGPANFSWGSEPILGDRNKTSKQGFRATRNSRNYRTTIPHISTSRRVLTSCLSCPGVWRSCGFWQETLELFPDTNTFSPTSDVVCVGESFPCPKLSDTL